MENDPRTPREQPKLMPYAQEINEWLIATVKHVYHVEYFLNEIGVGRDDPERPHDIVGVGNKFEWQVLHGFALQHRNHGSNVKPFVEESLRLHRQQYHHRKWNNYNPFDLTCRGTVSTDDMIVGAIDAVCSLLEDREYQGGRHDYDDVRILAGRNPDIRAYWMRTVADEMQRIVQPRIHLITSLHSIPNIGVDRHVHDAILARTDDEIRFLENECGYKIG